MAVRDLTRGSPQLRHTDARQPALDHAFDVDRLHELREVAAAHASELGLPDRQVDDLLVVVSELAANAIRHGGGAGRLRLWRHGSRLYCQINDQGPGITDTHAGNTPPDLGASTGRGLWISRQFSTELIIGQSGPPHGGATVTAILTIDSTTG